MLSNLALQEAPPALGIFMLEYILVPRAAILLASATDRELWQAGSPRITDFWLSASLRNLKQ